MTVTGLERPVVVGWSGSEVSSRALETAAGFAHRHGVPLRVILGWDFLDQPGEHWDPEITAAKVEAMLESALADLRLRYPDLEVHGDALMGWPPALVYDAAQDAGLLVVGRSAKNEGHFGAWSPDVLVKRVRCPLVFVP